MAAKKKTSQKKEIVLDTISDLVSNFLYYDRKDDEDLPREMIESMVAAGEITIDEIVKRFRTELESQL